MSNTDTAVTITLTRAQVDRLWSMARWSGDRKTCKLIYQFQSGDHWPGLVAAIEDAADRYSGVRS